MGGKIEFEINGQKIEKIKKLTYLSDAVKADNSIYK